MSERRQIKVVAAMIEREGRYLITQRRPVATLPLLWEFPGGRVEDNESDEEALKRELQEGMAVVVEVKQRAIHVEHTYSDYDIDFRVYHCSLKEGEIQHIGVHDHRWVLPNELDRYEFPAADEKSMRQLLSLS